MNKSKFLKKSLAAILAVLMIVAVVPLSAAAALDRPSVYVDHELASFSGGTYSISRNISDVTQVLISSNLIAGEDGILRVVKDDKSPLTLNANVDLTQYASSISGSVYTLDLEWVGDDVEEDGEGAVTPYKLVITVTRDQTNKEVGIDRVILDDDQGQMYDPSTFVITDSDITVVLPFGAQIPSELTTDESNSANAKKIFVPTSEDAVLNYDAENAPTANTTVLQGSDIKVGTLEVKSDGRTTYRTVKVKWQTGFETFSIDKMVESQIMTTFPTNAWTGVTFDVKVTMPYGSAVSQVVPTFTLGETMVQNKVRVDDLTTSTYDRPVTSGSTTLPTLKDLTAGTNPVKSDDKNGGATVVGGKNILYVYTQKKAGTPIPVTLNVVDQAKNTTAALTGIQITCVSDTTIKSNYTEIATSGTTNINLPKGFSGTTATIDLELAKGATATMVEEGVAGVSAPDSDHDGKVQLTPVTIIDAQTSKGKNLEIQVKSEDGLITARYTISITLVNEEARLTSLTLKGTDDAGDAVTLTATPTATSTTNQYRLNLKVPYTWQLQSKLDDVKVYALGSTGATIADNDSPANDLVALRGEKISAFTTKTAWTVANLFDDPDDPTANSVVLTVNNPRAQNSVNTYVICLIPDLANARKGHGIQSGTQLTSTNVYSQVTANNTYNVTVGTAKDSTNPQGPAVNTLRVDVPFSTPDATDLFAYDWAKHEGAYVFNASGVVLGEMSDKNYGTQNVFRVQSSTNFKTKCLDVYNSTTNTIDTANATTLLVISEKAYVDNFVTSDSATYTKILDAGNNGKLLQDLINANEATVYYVYAQKAAPETGHEIESITSTLDPDVKVSLDKVNNIVDIEVPWSYEHMNRTNSTNSKYFSLNFELSKMATIKVTPAATSNVTAVQTLKSDLGTAETDSPTPFFVFNGDLYCGDLNLTASGNWQYKITTGGTAGSAGDYTGTVSSGEVDVVAENGNLDTYTINVSVAKRQEGADILSLKSGNTTAQIANDEITLTLPVGSSLTAQKLDITASPMATVKINGVTYGADKNYNLATPLTITVESEVGADKNATPINKHTYTLTTTVRKGFSDVSTGDWYYPYVEAAVDADIIHGYEDGTFKPTNPITRQDFVVMVTNMLGVTTDNEATVPFVDEDYISSYARGAVAWCAENNILNGYDDGTFGPSKYITRSEAAKVIAVALGLDVTGTPDFNDVNYISGWALPYVAACQTANIFNGDNLNNFNGSKQITRAETAKVMVDSLKIK